MSIRKATRAARETFARITFTDPAGRRTLGPVLLARDCQAFVAGYNSVADVTHRRAEAAPVRVWIA